MSDLCEHCNMPTDRHTSDCPIRLARKNRQLTGDEKIISDLGKWMSDPDVKLVIRKVVAKHGVSSFGDLPPEVLAELHEFAETFLEESPTNRFEGDPRRMV